MYAMEATLMLAFLVLPGSLAGPMNTRGVNYDTSDRCASHCTGANKLQYGVGQTYEYDYQVSTVTSMHGASDDSARIDVKATVSIYILSKCELALSLSDVTLWRSEPNQPKLQVVDAWGYTSSLEQNVLRFSFQDGRIEDVCPSDAEGAVALNFKRGVLSAFQNSMNQHERDESLQEVDVTGTCPTHYKIQRGSKEHHFTKVKDLLGCSDRDNYRTSLQSTPLRLPDTIQSLPLLKGDHECVQKVSRASQVLSTSCTESLVFRPFSKKDAGARTETTQTLSHRNTSPTRGVHPDPVSRRTTLLYEHTPSERNNDQSLWAAKETLSELCRITVQDIPAEVPSLFTDLVYVMRDLTSEELMDIVQRVYTGSMCRENKEKAKKFFLDALPMAGTSSTVEVMTEMLLAGDVPHSEADLWITSLHFVQHPTEPMVVQLRRLLFSETYRMSSLLPVTSLINNFCQVNPGCKSNPAVGAVVDVLGDILGRDCRTANEDLIMTTLRAVGNIGFADGLATTLERCAERADNPINIRVLALQAYRGISCNANRKALMETFMNKGEDSELRIAAYLGVMQCWNEAYLRQIKQTLESESVNQVGSFVWSHLTNLAESSTPYKQELRNILDDEELQREFDMDRRKYSRNYELSFFSEKFGTGATAENNLIWSSKSFVPRSVMVNLTIDMLGHSVNLLEVGGRVQGVEMDQLVSRGLFSGGEKPKSKPPSKTCVKPKKMENMKNKFDVTKDELSASMYFRMFGNELAFKHFNEKEILSVKDKLDTKDILATLAKGQDISFTQSAMFLDSSVSVPTIGGMALTLSVNGTATVELQATGKMDLRKFSLKKMEAMFDVRPSGAVQFSGMMSVDAGATRAGLKMVTTLHTSTAVSGSMDLTNGQLLNVELDTPKENMDILNVKSEFFLIHNEAEQKQELINDRRHVTTEGKCTGDGGIQALGYELCGAVRFVKSSSVTSAPYFPFTGPVAAVITLHKRDIPKGVKLTGKYIKNKVSAAGQLFVDTPGSVEDRQLNIAYFMEDKSAEFELNSPWKSLLAKGSYTENRKSRIVTASVLDDGKEYKLVMQVDMKKEKGKTVWVPSLEITQPADSELFADSIAERVAVTGTIGIGDKLTDIESEFTITSALRKDPILLRGNYINTKKQHTLAGSFMLTKKDSYSATFQLLKTISGKKLLSGKLEPTITISTPTWRPLLLTGTIDFKQEKLAKVNLELTMDKTLKKPINLDFKVTKSTKKSIDRFRGNGRFTSQLGTIKTKGFVTAPADKTYTSKRGPLVTLKVTTDYSLTFVKNKALRKNRVLFSSKIHNKSTKSLQKYDVNFNLDSRNYPAANLIAKAEMSHKDKFTKTELTLRHGEKAKFVKDKTHELKTSMTLNHNIGDNSADIRYDLQLIYPQQDMEYQLKGKHEHQLKNKISFETYANAIYGKGKSVEVRLLGNDNSKKNRLDASGSLEVSYPEFKVNNKKVEGRSYKVSTSIAQTPEKEYVHTVNVQVNKDTKNTLVTKFKKMKNNQFNFFSELQAYMINPHTLTLKASRIGEDTQSSVELVMEDEIYKAEYTLKEEISTRSPLTKYYTNSWDIIWPDRRVKGSLSGGMLSETEVKAQFVTLWDADKDPSQKIDSELHYLFERTGLGRTESKKYDFSFFTTTPFEDHKIYSFKRLSVMNDKEVKEEFKGIWKTEDNELSYTFWLKKPPSLERFEMKTMLISPFALRKAGLDIVHKFDGSRHLSTTVKGMYNDEEMTGVVQVRNTGDTIRRNFIGSVTLTNTMPKMPRIVTFKLDHRDDGRVFHTEAQSQFNDYLYKVNLDATYFRIHYQVQVDSNLQVTFPSDRPLTLTWVHGNTLTTLNSTVSLNWKPEYDSRLIVGAKFSEAEKDYAIDITWSGPEESVRDIEYQIRFNMMNGYSGSTYARVNKNPKMFSTQSFKYTDSEFEYKSSDGQDNYLNLNAKYGHFPYTIYLEARIPSKQRRRWEGDKLVFDASVNENYENGWSANVKLATPWEDFETINARGNIKKAIPSEWTLDSEISLGVRKEITIDFTVDTEKWMKMNGRIETPYEKMRTMDFGFTRSRSGNVYSSSSHIKIQPIFNEVRLEHSQQMEPKFVTRYYLEIPDTEIKYLEVNIDNKENRRGCTTNVRVNYQNDKEINLKFKGKYNKKKFPEDTKVSLDLSTPFEVLPSLNIESKINKNEGKWSGYFDLKSTAEELEYFNMKLDHANTKTSCHSDFEIASSVFETVAAGVHYDWGDLKAANLTLTAPSIGRSMVGFKVNLNSWRDFENKVFAEVAEYKLDMDIGLKHNDELTKAWVVYIYPNDDLQDFRASVHRLGNSVEDFDIGGLLQIGKNARPYNISAQFSQLENKLAIGATLETPRTKSLSFYMNSEVLKNGQQNSKVYGMYGRKYLIDQTTTQRKTQSSYDYSVKNELIWNGKSYRGGSTVTAQWTDAEQKGSVHSYTNNHWFKVNTERQVQPPRGESKTQTISMNVFSPYDDFTDVGLQSEITNGRDYHHSKTTLEYMDLREAVLTLNIKKPSNNEVTADAELALPVEGYEKNTMTYRQVTRRDRFTADSEIITGSGEHLAGKLEFKNKEEFVLTLSGPIEEFESLTVTGKYNENEGRLNGDARLKLSLNKRPANLLYDINYKDKPVTVSLKLRSPYENIRKADLTIEHEGVDWKNIKTTATLKSEKLGEIVSATSWRFNSVKDMGGSSTLTSSLDHMENLKVVFSTQDMKDRQKSHLELGWEVDKEIVIDNEWSLMEEETYDSGPKITFETTTDMTTPFKEVQMAHMSLIHAHLEAKGMFSDKAVLIHNDKTYLDGSVALTLGRDLDIDLNKPRPMSLHIIGPHWDNTADGGDDDVIGGKIVFNWDKRSPEANIEVRGSFADRSDPVAIDKQFKFLAIHPVRTMGMDCSYKKAENEVLSSGQVTWDEENGHTFSYDLGWLNRTTRYSDMYEGHIKLGVPQRSVKVAGSYSNTETSLTTTSAVYWDADRDDKKKVTMETTVESKDNQKRVGLNINLPTINKQLNLGATTKGGYGSTLMDSKAEISYSSNPQKTIVVTSVITNSEIGSAKNFNYTLDIGFQHPITDTNLQLTTHMGSVKNLCSVGSRFSFLTARREQKTLEFLARADKAKNNVEVKVVTPMKSVEVKGKVDARKHRHQFTLMSYEDEKDALKLDFVLDARRRNMDVEFSYDQDDPSKMVTLSGRYVNDSAIQVDLISQDGREMRSESMIAVRLNSSHVLHTRILWRPTLFLELQNFMGTKVTAFSYVANEAFNSAVDSVGSEVKAKYLRVSQELRTEMGQVFKLMEKEMDSLSGQLEMLNREFRRFYQRNDLYIRDMGETSKAFINNLFNAVRQSMRNYRQYYTGITRATNTWLSDLKTYPIAQKYGAVIQGLVSGLKELREMLEEALNDITIELEKFSEVSYKQYLDIKRTIDRKLQSYALTVQKLPMYRQMVEQQAMLAQMGKKSMPQWAQVYGQAYLKGQELLQDQFHDMMTRPEFQYVHAVISEVHQQFMHWNMEQTLNVAFRRMLELSKNLALMEIMKLKRSLLEMEHSRMIVFNPEGGEIQFEVHLPFPLKSLAEKPKLKASKYLSHLRKATQFNLPLSGNTSIWDHYYDYVPSLEPSSWVPPFDGSAYLIGSQHILTFDGGHYDFLSQCSHILARDMLNDNFSVVVNYDQRPQREGIKSLCFNLEKNLHFEISDDYKVKMNGQDTEMPVITDTVMIVREGDFIRLNYIGGLEVICNPKLDIYKVTVKGWYHGRLAGLMGTYDNEPSNDEMEKGESDDFEVNRKDCRSRKNMAVTPNPARDRNGLCSKLFEEKNSKFRPCFKQVNPAPFMHMCQIYMAKLSKEKAVHKVTEQYRYVCQDEGVYISALKDYVPCESEDPFNVGGSDPLYQSADVVFVVEDNQCNQWASTSLGTMATEIDTALRSAGLESNRFALEGYGGSYEDQASVRTIKGQYFGEASHFLRAVETLRLPERNEPGDLVSAIRRAIDYPYRPGVAKVLIIAPCSECEVGFLERNLASALNSKGFIVHTLQEQGYTLNKGNNYPGKFKVYGMDNSKTFTNHLPEARVEVQEVQIAKPRDYCGTMAQTTNGAIFDTTHLKENLRVNREFIQSFAHRVGWDTKLPACQSCQCNMDTGRTECQLCDDNSIYAYLPWRPPTLPEAIGSLHDFNHDMQTYFGFKE